MEAGFSIRLIGRDTVMIHHMFWQRTVLAAALGGILLIVYHLYLFLPRGSGTSDLQPHLPDCRSAPGDGEQCPGPVFPAGRI